MLGQTMFRQTAAEVQAAASYARKRSPYRRRAGALQGSGPARGERAVKPPAVVRKAVFPVAGLDTALLPATKAPPNEMLTVVDKPLIHYAVEEAIAAGIREMIFVTSRHKRAIEDHFDMAYELEATLAGQSRDAELSDLRRLFPPDVRYLYVRQHDYSGVGSALTCARPLVGDEPFALILADELIDGRTPAIAQLIECFNTMQQPVVGVHRAEAGDPAPDFLRTGSAYRERTHHVVRFVREGGSAEGEFIAAGRYILDASVFPHLERVRAAGAEAHGLHDALQALLAEEPLLACEIDGERFSCATKLGLLKATVHFGLKHPEVARAFRELIGRVGAAPQRAVAAPLPSRRTST
jgi:UTP--glucose-1-phosphate uridylyltransferase